MKEPVFPYITIVTGATEHGKTYRSMEEFRKFIYDDPKFGRKGRPVLFLDTNDEFRDVKEIRYNVADPNDNGKYLANFVHPELRRIRLFVNGRPMTMAQKQKTLLDAVENFRRGALVCDDFNNYMSNYNDPEVISFLINSRHKGIDLTLQFQSVAKIATTMWENIKILRMHYQVDNIDRYAERIPNFELIKIAQLIVNKVYHSRGKMSKYYFVYVDVRNQKIIGPTKEVFIHACIEYAKKYLRAEMKQEMVAYTLNQNEALKKQVSELTRKYFQG